MDNLNELKQLKKVQNLCKYCWSSELQHMAAEEQAKVRAAELGTDSYIKFPVPVEDGLYSQAVMCDRRDFEGKTNYSFEKAKPEDLMFFFPKEVTETTRHIICHQRRVKNHGKYMKLEMFHALKALAQLHAARPKQTVIDFTRMLAESMLPQNSSELLIQAVAKEIYLSATTNQEGGNQSA